MIDDHMLPPKNHFIEMIIPVLTDTFDPLKGKGL